MTKEEQEDDELMSAPLLERLKRASPEIALLNGMGKEKWIAHFLNTGPKRNEKQKQKEAEADEDLFEDEEATAKNAAVGQ